MSAAIKLVPRASCAALLSLAEVKRITGLSAATLYRLRRAGQFPVPIKVSRRRIGWVQSEVENWLAQRERIDLATPHA